LFWSRKNSEEVIKSVVRREPRRMRQKRVCVRVGRSHAVEVEEPEVAERNGDVWVEALVW
jgi:hypothetical protein